MATRKTASITESQLELTAAREETRDFGVLNNQPKVQVCLPLNPNDKLNLPLEVFLNGVPYFVPRGVSVEVPSDIAAILTNARMV